MKREVLEAVAATSMLGGAFKKREINVSNMTPASSCSQDGRSGVRTAVAQTPGSGKIPNLSPAPRWQNDEMTKYANVRSSVVSSSRSGSV